MSKKRFFSRLSLILIVGVILTSVNVPNVRANEITEGSSAELIDTDREVIEIKSEEHPSGDLDDVQIIRNNLSLDEIIQSDQSKSEKGENVDLDSGELVFWPEDSGESYPAWRGGNKLTYNVLSDSMKNFYDECDLATRKFVASETFLNGDYNEDTKMIARIISDVGVSYQDAIHAYFAYFYDNPQYYFVSNYINFQSFKDAEGNQRSYVQFYIDEYYYKKDARKTAEDAINANTDKFVNDINSYRTDYEKILRAHDIVNYNTVYEGKDYKYGHSIAGWFTGQGVVCEGYSKVFQYFLNLCNIECLYVIGNAGGGGHAWNAVKFDGKYYFIDTTWDDGDATDDLDGFATTYEYFCLPLSIMNNDHHIGTDNSLDSWFPKSAFTYGDDTDHTFYIERKCYSADALTDESAQALVESAKEFHWGNYLFFAVPRAGISMLYAALGYPDKLYSFSGKLGQVAYYRYSTTDVPAESLVIDAGERKVDVKGTLNVTGTIPENSNDRILWTVSNPQIAGLDKSYGKNVTLKGKRNGVVTLSAITHFSGIKQEVTITVGNGIATDYDATIWAGGYKDKKTVTLDSSLTATNWKDSKGKEKKGRIVRLIMTEPTEIVYDKEKHTVKTKSNGTKLVSISSKNVVSAKKPGEAYIYIIDTGKLEAEEYVINVKQAATSLKLSYVKDSVQKNDLAKTSLQNFGITEKIYIVPAAPKGLEVDSELSYSVSFQKEEYKNYIEVSEIEVDSNGTASFSVKAKSHMKDKAKDATARINVINNESNRKIALTVKVSNNVVKVSASLDNDKQVLAKKNDKVDLKLDIQATDATSKTTDKIKLFVAKDSATLDSKQKKVTVDKGATVRAKLSKDNSVITLTASKDAGIGAKIYVAVTNSLTKLISLFEVASVDENGNVLPVVRTE